MMDDKIGGTRMKNVKFKWFDSIAELNKFCSDEKIEYIDLKYQYSITTDWEQHIYILVYTEVQQK